MTDRPSGGLDGPVNSLADLQLSEQTLDSVLGHIGRAAVDALPGWDAAGATLATAERMATYGITDERVIQVDQSQYDADAGPCVDAMKSGDFKYFDGTSHKDEWAEFAAAADDAGIHSVASFPLKLGGEVLGALNLYSKFEDALGPGQSEEGSVFAAQAAVTIANVKELLARSEQIEQLEDGLQTRTMIGQATGLLMAQEGLTSDEAFQKLVFVSQNANLKLREIAQRYVQTWETKVKGDAS
jgi:GAF domain-containing protein